MSKCRDVEISKYRNVEISKYRGPPRLSTFQLLFCCGELDASAQSLFVGGDEVVVACGQGFAQGLEYVLDLNYGVESEQGTEDYHVEALGVAHLCGYVHSIDFVDVDICAAGRDADAVAVVDEGAAGFDLRLELLQRGLVEDDGGVESADDGRADALVADDDGDVGGAATLFRSVGGHPRYFLTLHECAVSEDLAHREDALSAEAGYDDFLSHE